MGNRIQIYAGRPVEAALAAVPSDSPSGRLNTVCERYDAIIRHLISEISLSRAEWHAVIDANNGVDIYTGDQQRWPEAMIWANVHDARGLSERWGVDQRALVAKLQGLPRPALIAIQEFIDRVWSVPQRPVDEVLAECGVTPAAIPPRAT